MEVEILTPNVPAARACTGPKVAQDLRDVGIKASAKIMDFRSIVGIIIGTRENHKPWNVAIFGVGLGRIPDLHWLLGTGGFLNEILYHASDPEFD